MREILFRGKRDDTGEWIYGYYKVGMSGRTTIYTLTECLHEVIPETVGQYIGLVDKKDNKIFEGDIVRFVPSHTNKYCDNEWRDFMKSIDDLKTDEDFERFNDEFDEKENNYLEKFRVNREVKFRDGIFYCRGFYGYEGQEVNFDETEIVGNVHDNPDLAEVENDINVGI